MPVAPVRERVVSFDTGLLFGLSRTRYEPPWSRRDRGSRYLEFIAIGQNVVLADLVSGQFGARVATVALALGPGPLVLIKPQ